MNKYLVVLGVGVLAVIGWFLFAGDNMDYVVVIDEEVAALETEFAQIEAALEAGTLTPEEAAEAQMRIASRLDAINSSVANGGERMLTEVERRQLAAALERLKQALIRYRDTLTSVDEAVLELPEADRPQLRRGSGSGRQSIAAIVTETVDTLEDYIEDVVENDESDDVDDTATTSDEMVDDSATSSDESTDEEDMDGGENTDAGEAENHEEESSETDDTTDTETEETQEDTGTEVEADAEFDFSESASGTGSTETEETTN